jgi:hypothetical protein
MVGMSPVLFHFGMRRAAGVIGSAALVFTVVFAGHASAIAPDGHRTFHSGSGKLSVEWVGACNVNLAPDATVGTWSPTLDLKVVETGVTKWKAIELEYKYRAIGETFIVSTITADISQANTVVDPAVHVYNTKRIARSDDAYGVGFKLLASTDGTNFKVTVFNPGLLNCTPDPEPTG